MANDIEIESEKKKIYVLFTEPKVSEKVLELEFT